MALLKIALLAPLKRLITPQTTVSRNRIVAELAKGLLQKGHNITIFGTSDSYLPGIKFVGVVEKGLVDLPSSENPFYTDTAYITHAIMKLISEQERFDIIHNHMYPEFLPLIGGKLFKTPIVTTVHAQITPELNMALNDVKGSTKLISISESAKRALSSESTVVYNGVDTNFFLPNDSQKSYLLFVGRMSKARTNGKFMDPKGVSNAIKVAKNLGENLKIVGNVEDRRFYDELIAPHLGRNIQFVGKISSEQTLSRKEMVGLLQNAKAFVFPVNWEEPFGLVMIEAISCGTPVVAFNRGAVTEIVRDGLTGFIVDPLDRQVQNEGKWIIKNKGIEGLIEAVKRIGEIDRRACRKHAEDNFTVGRMVEGYEKIYQEILGGKT